MAYGTDEAELRSITTQATPRSIAESHNSFVRDNCGLPRCDRIAVWFAIVDTVPAIHSSLRTSSAAGSSAYWANHAAMPDTMVTHVFYTLLLRGVRACWSNYRVGPSISRLRLPRFSPDSRVCSS